MTQIRALQHFLYCPHRWELLYREGMWQDNAFTVKADLVHERVHSGKTLSRSKGRIVLSDVSLFSEKWGIYGKCDSLELIPDEDGASLEGFPLRYRIALIEYKPTHPKEAPNASDRLQLYAQKLCAEELFPCRVDAYLYYADVGKRVRVSFDEEDQTLLKDILAQIRLWEENGSIPPISFGAKCNGCSIRDRCMPRCKGENTRKLILKELSS